MAAARKHAEIVQRVLGEQHKGITLFGADAIIADMDRRAATKAPTVYHHTNPQTGLSERSYSLSMDRFSTEQKAAAMKLAAARLAGDPSLDGRSQVGLVVDILKEMENQMYPTEQPNYAVSPTTPGFIPNAQLNEAGGPMIGTPNQRTPSGLPQQLQPQGFAGASVLPAGAPQEGQIGFTPAKAASYDHHPFASPQTGYGTSSFQSASPAPQAQLPRYRVAIHVDGFGRIDVAYHYVELQRHPAAPGALGEPFAIYLTYDNNYKGGARYTTEALEHATLVIEGEPVAYIVEGTPLIHHFKDPVRGFDFSTSILTVVATQAIG